MEEAELQANQPKKTMSRIIAFASIATTAAFSPSSAYKPIVTSRRTGPVLMPDYDSWAARVNLDIRCSARRPRRPR